MPIIVTEITWRQSETTVHIQVPLTGTHAKVDLFTTDSYIKAHYAPYLFEIFLRHDVDITKSKCIVKSDEILMDLIKRDNIHWESLEKNLHKADKIKTKNEILEKCQEEAKQAEEDKKIRKSQLDRFTVQQAMEIDSRHHALMDSRRDEERKKAMDDLEDWKSQTIAIEYYKPKSIVETATVTEISSSEDEDETKELVKDQVTKDIVTKENKNEISSSDDKDDAKESIKDKVTHNIVTKENKKPEVPMKEIKTPVRSQYVEKKREEMAKRTLPKLRETVEIEVKHTQRTFPTPSRESAAAEEEEWLKNITLARRATGFMSEDLRPEEQDPQWCKEKGDEFFKSGNFLGAISAYTHGITLSDKLPSLYSNRAATHFALGNFNKCANDCSTALELMVPACEGNRKSRAKCIARRAAALARIGYLNKAIDEMKAASKLLPDDETIKKDIYDMERAWEQNPDSD